MGLTKSQSREFDSLYSIVESRGAMPAKQRERFELLKTRLPANSPTGPIEKYAVGEAEQTGVEGVTEHEVALVVNPKDTVTVKMFLDGRVGFCSSCESGSNGRAARSCPHIAAVKRYLKAKAKSNG